MDVCIFMKLLWFLGCIIEVIIVVVGIFWLLAIIKKLDVMYKANVMDVVLRLVMV